MTTLVSPRLYTSVMSAIGADRSRGPSQGQNHIALAGAMARIHNDGQMAGPLHCGNDTEVKCIARVIGEGAYSALAQNHLVIAFAHDILGSHQQFVQCC